MYVMESVRNEQLTKEYAERFDGIHYIPLKISGYWRIDFKDGRFVEKPITSLLYNILLCLFNNTCMLYVLYVTTMVDNVLIITEIIMMINLAFILDCLLITSSTIRKRSSIEIINSRIEIDTFLGVEETKFMRNMETKTYEVLSYIITTTGLLFITFMVIFTVIVNVTHGIATIGFLLGIHSIFYDVAFTMLQGSFLTLRTRYLNIALMKLANINVKYLANIITAKGLSWKNELDDLVEFHTRAEPSSFLPALNMIIDQLRHVEDNCSPLICLCMIYIIAGTFATVQTQVIFFKSGEKNILRLAALTAWTIISWIFAYSGTQYFNMFTQQIEQTRLICNYIQLKPSSEEISRLAKSIIGTLKVRDVKLSVYGIFYFNAGFMLSLTTSILLYITILLQFAFPIEQKSRRYSGNTTAFY